jgi:hypothetical protein
MNSAGHKQARQSGESQDSEFSEAWHSDHLDIAVLKNRTHAPKELASKNRLSIELFVKLAIKLQGVESSFSIKPLEISKQIRSTGVSASHGDFRRFLYEATTIHVLTFSLWKEACIGIL